MFSLTNDLNQKPILATTISLVTAELRGILLVAIGLSRGSNLLAPISFPHRPNSHIKISWQANALLSARQNSF
jgi:hypothetical protein